jgi:tRNA G18 (ribose-2'-O)-methylase SpoU
MRKLSHEEIAKNRFSVESLKGAERLPIYVMLDNIRSLYNVGSMFRSSDGARIEKLLLCGYTPHPPRKEIEKTALGATSTVPWEYFKNPKDAIAWVKSRGIALCVLEHTDSSVPYYSLTPAQFPLCLVVGNEITGISKDIVSEADLAVDIPMYGLKQSLNVAVAYGIALYEFVRILKRS